MSVDVIYCDNCGSSLETAECVAFVHSAPCARRRHYVSELPVGVDSANAGESAVLCAACFEAVLVGDEARLRWLTSNQD